MLGLGLGLGLDAEWLGGLCRLSAERCGDYGVEVVHVEGVFSEELGASCGVTLLVAGA